MQVRFPPVHIIILSWNSRRHLEYCLPSVSQTQYPNYRIVVVDNGSSDDSPNWVVEHFPQVSVLQTGENLGYAGGNNAGIRHALEQEAAYVALLNPDTRVDPRWLTEAVKVAEEHPEIGLIGFRVFGEYKREDLDSSQFTKAIADWRQLEVKSTHHISGCALFCRAELFQRVGLLDEVYFAYAEEDDLERRAVKAGYEMVRLNVPVWHYGEGNFSKLPWQASRLALRNTIRCTLKNDPPRRIIRELLFVFSVACNPFSSANRVYFHQRRLRPSNVLINGVLLAEACLWNLLHLPQTMDARQASEKQILATPRRSA